MNRDDPSRYDAAIAKALATQGGHLSIGRGGFTLHYENARLSGYDYDVIKPVAIAAGLPVIDSRMIPFELAAKLAVSGPMVAVNAAPSPRPWHALAYAPLGALAAAYRRAGADVFNAPDDPTYDGCFDAIGPGPASTLIDFWLNHVRTHNIHPEPWMGRVGTRLDVDAEQTISRPSKAQEDDHDPAFP